MNRAQHYKNVFDVRSGFMRTRKNGNWLSPFDPREVNSNYTEANAWQYSFYVPQDFAGYMEMLGGKEKLNQQLDALFSAPSNTTGRAQSDITGLIGQYAHGNEPSHHIAYLYNHAGRPDKTADQVKFIMDNFYKNTPDGLIGNEDCGQMSAWYVMSALGFYPVTPGSNKYEVGTPLFKKAVVKAGGSEIIFNAENLSDSAKYVAAIGLDDGGDYIRPLQNFQIPHSIFKKSGTINFRMATKMSATDFRFNEDQLQAPLATGFVPLPIIKAASKTFRRSMLVECDAAQVNSRMFYTTDGTLPTLKSKPYADKILIDTSSTLKIFSVDANGNQSKTLEARFQLIPNDWSIRLNSLYQPIYDAGGSEGLIDGIKGDENWRKGNWQGYQKTNLDAVIDFKESRSIQKVSVSLLQDVGSWIVFPKQVDIYGSNDGIKFEKLASQSPGTPVTELNPVKHSIVFSLPNLAYRYIRIVAEQYGKLPSWHESPGGDTHIFVDEIEVE